MPDNATLPTVQSGDMNSGNTSVRSDAIPVLLHVYGEPLQFPAQLPRQAC